MSSDRRYTYAEARTALAIDSKTLRLWVRREHWEGEHGEPFDDGDGHPLIATDELDKRVKYLSREQLLALAKRHKRDLRETTERPQRASAAVRDLQAQLAEVKAEIARIRQRAPWLFAENASTTRRESREAPPTGTEDDLPAVRPQRRHEPVSASESPHPPIPEGAMAFSSWCRYVAHEDHRTIERLIAGGRMPQPIAGKWRPGSGGTAVGRIYTAELIEEANQKLAEWRQSEQSGSHEDE